VEDVPGVAVVRPWHPTTAVEQAVLVKERSLALSHSFVNDA
jgi:hypothetical protein